MDDEIIIEGLEVWTWIGVGEEERSCRQRVELGLRLSPRAGLRDLGDRIENTIDYAAVCDEINAVAAARPRALIETLAEDILDRLLASGSLLWAQVEVRKFVVPRTRHVAVRIARSMPDARPGGREE